MQNKENIFFRKFNNSIVGNENKFNFECRFINSLSIGIGITSLIGFIINVTLHMNIVEIYLTLINSIIYFIVYCLSRFYNKVNIAKWMAIVSAYIILSFLWINSAGSLGPIPYAYFLLVMSVVLITDGWSRAILLFVLPVNIIILFYIENKYSSLFVEYVDDSARRIDMLSSILLYFTLGTIIMSYAKKSYIKEKINAQKADKLKSAFLANMSHEIRTPMNAIMGFTGLLRNENLSNEKKEKYHKTVNESVEYLLRLIDDILDISRIEADELVIVPKKFDLDEFFNFLQFSLAQLIPEDKKNKIKLIYNNPGIHTFIETDKTRLEQIITNLILNSFKFTNEGTIKFGFDKKNRSVLFYVQDTGIGIDEKDKDAIFERFVKIENTNFEILQRGTGIGLAIVKKVIELLHGKIWLESKLNQGSTFYFTIPTEINFDKDKVDIKKTTI